MSVGINLPVKTTIFTDVKKFNGETNRMLYSHEYTQAAGRAGRLGLDSVGHVIHLNNLFRNIDFISYKTMMNGKPQSLTSKFKISYNLLLNLVDIGDKNIVNFAKKSMVTNDLDNQMKEIYNLMNIKEIELDKLILCTTNLRTPITIIEELIDLQLLKINVVNKKRKEIERKIEQIFDNYKFIEQDKLIYLKMKNKENEMDDLKKQYDNLNNFLQCGVNSVLNLLQKEKFIEVGEEKDDING
jgi:superfamily II RNA helicase